MIAIPLLVTAALALPQEGGTEAGRAPDVFGARFETSAGTFVIGVRRTWAPRGADRFHELVAEGFYDGAGFFRVIDGFMAQFGIAGDPALNARWKDARIQDDPVIKANLPGFVSFAKTGQPDSRTTQVFINTVDNRRLDAMGFAPFGKVVEGMDVVRSLYSEYGEGAPRGRGPSQTRIQAEGNAYLEAEFPELDHVVEATIVELSPEAVPDLEEETSEVAPRDVPPGEGREAPAFSDDEVIEQVDAFVVERSVDTATRTWRTRLPRFPDLSFDDGERYLWHLQTNEGLISIELMPDVAPDHVSSTIYLTRLGFYDGLTFHRVIPGFMAQGGCPIGTGTGGPGYAYEGEFDDDVTHARGGLLSMANRGPGTDGSQFFLTFVPTPHLDGKHTIFGEVVVGMDTLERLEEAGTRGGTPEEEPVIEKATVTVEDRP